MHFYEQILPLTTLLDKILIETDNRATTNTILQLSSTPLPLFSFRNGFLDRFLQFFSIYKISGNFLISPLSSYFFPYCHPFSSFNRLLEGDDSCDDLSYFYFCFFNFNPHCNSVLTDGVSVHELFISLLFYVAYQNDKK